jgi:hypothetical protein
MFAQLLLRHSLAAQSATLLAVSSPLNDYNISFDARERVMVLARSKADFKEAAIYISQRAGKSWTRPARISFSDARYNDSDPWLTPDGRTLYFISDRPAPGREEGRKDYDIWRSHRSGPSWSAPEHLGPEINGRGQELGPELHGGWLYFASARRSGLGGLDIYRAEAAGRRFKPAALMPGPFNSASSDSDFTLSPDGSAAMFWRTIGENGTIHIAYRGAAGWSEAQPLGDAINLGPFNFTPSFTRDGRRIRFASTRERPGQPSGYADLFESELPKR